MGTKYIPLLHQESYNEFVYAYFVASRILRGMSTNSFVTNGIIFLNPTSGLAEADGSWRKLTEADGRAKNR